MDHVDHDVLSGECDRPDPGGPGRSLTVQATDACQPPDPGSIGRTLAVDATDGATAGD